MNGKGPGKGNAISRFVDENWKGFVAGALVVSIPLGWSYYRAQQQEWGRVDETVTSLVNTVINVDSVPPTLQPAAMAKRWERMKFLRNFQENAHPDDFTQFEKQIPWISEDSDVDRYKHALGGHQSVGIQAHGYQRFAKTVLRQRTNAIEKSFDGEVFLSSVELLAYVQTANLERLIPTSETDEQVKWLLISEDELRRYEDTPRIDLLDPRVRDLLVSYGVEASLFRQTTMAVPALTELSDTAFQVQDASIQF